MHRKLLRAAAVLLALALTLSLCGCTSIFMDIAPEADEDEEDGYYSDTWGAASYETKVVTTYPAGKDAFYVDESKCIKSEIEEFHLLALVGDVTMYYFTAPSNPAYTGAEKKSGYYCLATYNFETATYTPLEEGFYKKEAGSVSMASDFDIYGDGMACIGDTFMYISNMTIQYKFTLSNDDKQTIKDAVGGEYFCFDISLLDVYSYCITAAFMRVPSADSDLEDDEEFRSMLYAITFDTSEEPNHTMERLSGGLDGSVGNLCSAFSGDSELSGFIFAHDESEEQNYVALDRFQCRGEEIADLENINLTGKSEEESLKGFTACTASGNDYVLLLYSDRLELWRCYSTTIANFLIPTSYENVTAIRLDDSTSYIAIDEVPSIAVYSEDMIYTCSLTEGFRQFKVNASGKTTTTTFAGGAYYAAYSEDGSNCTLIGFNNNVRKQTASTYSNGELSSSQTTETEYTMNDLPYAKIYTTYVGVDSFPVNTGATPQVVTPISPIVPIIPDLPVFPSIPTLPFFPHLPSFPGTPVSPLRPIA